MGRVQSTLRSETRGPVNQPTVLIVSYHFYPSNEIGARRPTALAQYLVDRGLRVVVVSAFAERHIELGADILPGVQAVPVHMPSRTLIGTVVALKRKLRRTPTSGDVREPFNPSPPAPGSSSGSLGHTIRELFFRVAYFMDDSKRWGLRARRAAIRAGKRHAPILILSSSPPLSVPLAGTLAAKRLGVPHIADLRDPWSDVVADLHPAWARDLAVQRKIERWMMQSATAITSTTATVIRLLTDRQPELAAKTFLVRNGYDGVARRTGLDTGGRLSIFFAGNLYLNRDPLPLLQALERLLSRPDVDAGRIRVTFMGPRAAPVEKALTRWLQGKRCAGVVALTPAQPAEAVAAATTHSTVLLNLAQHQPMSVPAKTFEHLASGRENLLLCENDSETALLVKSIPGVIQVDPRDASAMDRVLLDLYDRHVNQGRLRAPTEGDISKFSRGAANDLFWSIIQSVTSIDTRRAAGELSC